MRRRKDSEFDKIEDIIEKNDVILLDNSIGGYPGYSFDKTFITFLEEYDNYKNMDADQLSSKIYGLCVFENFLCSDKTKLICQTFDEFNYLTYFINYFKNQFLSEEMLENRKDIYDLFQEYLPKHELIRDVLELKSMKVIDSHHTTYSERIESEFINDMFDLLKIISIQGKLKEKKSIFAKPANYNNTTDELITTTAIYLSRQKIENNSQKVGIVTKDDDFKNLLFTTMGYLSRVNEKLNHQDPEEFLHNLPRIYHFERFTLFDELEFEDTYYQKYQEDELAEKLSKKTNKRINYFLTKHKDFFKI
ncbi:hypothetical protein KY334_03435 [Candidatus Woesearchaeota archaeon]|nr:hypothetical protein [Candidatus Woesearchaeota archaeon]